MSRRRTAPELRLVDEEAENEERRHYYRLDPDSRESIEQEVIKLVPEQPEIRKLNIPTRVEVETRTNEPDIDNLITVTNPGLDGMEEDWGQAPAVRKPIPIGWFVLLGMLVLIAGVWAIVHIRTAGDAMEVVRIETEQIIDTERQSIARASDQIEAIHKALMAFGMAETVDQKAAAVRQAERVKPLMADHYSRHPLRPLGRPRLESLNPLTLGNRGQFWIASTSFERSPEKLSLIIESKPDGTARIDWETIVCYQPMAWDDYARRRPGNTTMDFRVYVKPDSFFTHEFQDSSQWDSYQLTALDSEEFLFGYVHRDSPTAEFLRQFFQSNASRAAPMILRLTLPHGLESPRGVLIEDVLSIRWIYVVPPDDNS